MKEADYIDAIQEHGDNFSLQEFLLKDGTDITDYDHSFFVSYLKYRQWSQLPHLVISAYRPQDAGAHGSGQAIDHIMFDKWLERPTEPMHLWRMATTWPFKGVGIYFDWSYYGKDGKEYPAVGLHVDDWSKSGAQRPLRWLRLRIQSSRQPQVRYFYQSVKHGHFYNEDLDRTITLQEAIDTYRERLQ